MVNKGEGTGEQSVCDCYSLCLLPAFLYAVENQLTSLVRVESILLIQLAVISLLRLVNRVERDACKIPQHYHYPPIFGKLGQLLFLVAIMRIYENRRK